MNTLDLQHKEIKLSFIDSCSWFLGVLALLLLRWGYIYGSGDQVEILPYALKLNETSLFSNDFFISHIAESVVNQRWATATLLSWFGDFMPLGSLLLFIICLFLLVRGLQYLFLTFYADLKHSQFWSFCFVLVALLLTQGWSPGGNDLYAESLLPDSVSRVFVVWSFYFFFRSEYLISFLLVGLATLFQPLMGFQVFLLYGGVVLFSGSSVFSIIKQVSIYFIGGGWLFIAMAALVLHGTEPGDTSAYFDTYFGFRAPHHFLPSYFFNWQSVLFFCGVLYATLHFYTAQKKVFKLLALACLGCIVYAFGVEWFGSRLIASAQWFKVTQWLKIFLLLAVFGRLKKCINLGDIFLLRYGKLVSGFSGVVVLLVLIFYPSQHPLGKELAFKGNSSAQGLYVFVKENTTIDDVFIVPLGNTDFKYGAERSLFVDFKSIDPSPPFVHEWKRRIELVYGSTKGAAGFGFQKSANAIYHKPTSNRIKVLKRNGVSYILASQTIRSVDLEEVYREADGIIYRIKK